MWNLIYIMINYEKATIILQCFIFLIRRIYKFCTGFRIEKFQIIHFKTMQNSLLKIKIKNFYSRLHLGYEEYPNSSILRKLNIVHRPCMCTEHQGTHFIFIRTELTDYRHNRSIMEMIKSNITFWAVWRLISVLDTHNYINDPHSHE